MDTVTVDRHKFIGASEIGTIFGINPFETRYHLLLKKAEIIENDFQGNAYTEYGNVMEDKIRQFINETHERNFEPDYTINGFYRSNCDGVDTDTILEIKTTSQGDKELEKYTLQTMKYMHDFGKQYGWIAIYDRPSDFDETFDESRLTIHTITYDETLVNEIHEKCEKFMQDLDFMKTEYIFENRIVTEEELLSDNSLVVLSNQIIKFEQDLAQMKVIETQIKELKEQLKTKMEQSGIKKWETPNGTKVTLVEDKPDEEVEEFNKATFEDKYPSIVNACTVMKPVIEWDTVMATATEEQLKECSDTKIKKGRKGYVKITLPKN